jgi:hypothetical protein
MGVKMRGFIFVLAPRCLNGVSVGGIRIRKCQLRVNVHEYWLEVSMNRYGVLGKPRAIGAENSSVYCKSREFGQPL